MSTPKHTPGPWGTNVQEPQQVWTSTPQGTCGVRIASCRCSPLSKESDNANAARIVECVNAMEGLDPSKLAAMLRAVEVLLHESLPLITHGEDDLMCVPTDGTEVLRTALAALRSES